MFSLRFGNQNPVIHNFTEAPSLLKPGSIIVVDKPNPPGMMGGRPKEVFYEVRKIANDGDIYGQPLDNIQNEIGKNGVKEGFMIIA